MGLELGWTSEANKGRKGPREHEGWEALGQQASMQTLELQLGYLQATARCALWGKRYLELVKEPGLPSAPPHSLLP